MKLKVIGTGSQGNCYLIGNDEEAIMIDCGARMSHVKKALDFKTKHVVGCLVTHSHGDHCKFANETTAIGIDLFGLKDTFDVLDLNQKHKVNEIKPGYQFRLKNFGILPFEVQHDVPTLGFLIHHKEIGNLVFITDTYYCRYKFNDINHIVVEANYSETIIEEKTKLEFLRDRVYKSHFSLENCIDFLKMQNLKQCRNIVLIHLSDTNSDEAMFMREVVNATGMFTTVAKNGIKVNLSSPF